MMTKNQTKYKTLPKSEWKHEVTAFKKGDKVCVAYKFNEEDEVEDWDNTWADMMDKMLYNVYTVESSNSNGVYFEEGEAEYQFSFGFPSCSLVLVLVAEAQEPEPIKEPVDKSVFTDKELQMLQTILKFELNQAQEWLKEAKSASGELWAKCDPSKSHHSDVAYAYNTLNELKKAIEKVKKLNDVASGIQNKVKWQLGNKK